MEKNYSYAEFIKAVGRNSSSFQAERLLNEIYMDLFLNRIHREQTKERLTLLIDFALDSKDEVAFMELSKKLVELEEL
ncbi:IDEAL domain-containing protein [Sporosarcina sp. CAU 1771]